ncbi:S-layer homology domain-containing protein [Candidatus Peregrinibacteria bacterium]|nr:S-layer homology domain-containing protein [Candidatus Peregrinibacteria bacterium]
MKLKKFIQQAGFYLLLVAMLATSSHLAFAETQNLDDSNNSEDAIQDDEFGPDDNGDESFDDFDPCSNNDCQVEVSADIDATLEEVEKAESFVKALKDSKIDTSEINDSIDQLDELIRQAKSTLTAFKDELKNGSFDHRIIEKFWDVLDEVNQAASDQVSLIYDYLQTHPDLLDKLKKSIPDVITLMENWSNQIQSEDFDAADIMEELDLTPAEDELTNYFKEMSDKFEKDIFEKVMRNVKGQIVDELKKYFDDETALAASEEILNGIDIFGDSFTNDVLQNEFSVLDVIDGISEENLKGAQKGRKIQELIDETKNIVIPNSFKQELIDEWRAIVDALTPAPADQDTNAIKEEIQKIEKTLMDIDHENVFGENAVEFNDVQMDDKEWFWKPVMSARREGIINGYTNTDGSMTGNFGPADNVTYAQALKMSMEAADHHEESDSEGLWYQNYLNGLDGLSLGRLNSKTFSNWDAPATRGDVILIMNQIFGIKPVKYVDGTFHDVKAEDPIADDAMASKLAGIFTGEGDTGNLNPDGNINRAGFAKAIGIALDYKNNGDLADKLKDFQQKNIK